MKRSAISLTLLLAAPCMLGQEVKVERHVTTVREPDVNVPNVQVQEVHRAKSKKLARINADVNRLESILATIQNRTLPSTSLKSTANEANVLASRIYANVHSSLRGNSDAVNAATQLRMHIREMCKAAAAGNAAGVQSHARESLPFAARLDSIV
jgi:hypothetical protein